jgi:hypothetical protein
VFRVRRYSKVGEIFEFLICVFVMFEEIEEELMVVSANLVVIFGCAEDCSCFGFDSGNF